MKYVITIEFESDYVPAEVMDDVALSCQVQVEGLTDGTLESMEDCDDSIPYTNLTSKWERSK